MLFSKSPTGHFSFNYLVILGLLFLTACSSTPTSSTPTISDPIEPLNRAFWKFTWDYSDKYVTRPATVTYITYTPSPLRKGLHNIALNLNEPANFMNNLLQGKFTEAATSVGRFVLNSTIGLLGFFDPASDFGWTVQEEEFGEVLGFYGVSDGPYIVIPGIGPSSVREEVGDFVDRFYWPLAVIDFWPNLIRWAIIGMEKRAALIPQEPLLLDAMDPYEFVKNAYIQNMNFKLWDGNPPIIVNAEEEADIEALLEGL